MSFNILRWECLEISLCFLMCKKKIYIVYCLAVGRIILSWCDPENSSLLNRHNIPTSHHGPFYLAAESQMIVHACSGFFLSCAGSSILLFLRENVPASCLMILAFCQSCWHQGTWATDPRQAIPWRPESRWSSQHRKRALLASLGEPVGHCFWDPQRALASSPSQGQVIWLLDSVSDLCPSHESYSFVCIHKNRVLLLALKYPI